MYTGHLFQSQRLILPLLCGHFICQSLPGRHIRELFSLQWLEVLVLHVAHYLLRSIEKTFEHRAVHMNAFLMSLWGNSWIQMYSRGDNAFRLTETLTEAGSVDATCSTIPVEINWENAWASSSSHQCISQPFLMSLWGNSWIQLYSRGDNAFPLTETCELKCAITTDLKINPGIQKQKLGYSVAFEW